MLSQGRCVREVTTLSAPSIRQTRDARLKVKAPTATRSCRIAKSEQPGLDWQMKHRSASAVRILAGLRINETQSQEAVVTHKHAPSEHVTGDRAVNKGIKDIVLGGVTLVLGDSI